MLTTTSEHRGGPRGRTIFNPYSEVVEGNGVLDLLTTLKKGWVYYPQHKIPCTTFL